MKGPAPTTEAWPQSDQEACPIRNDSIELFAIRLMLTDESFAVTLTGGRRSVGHALNEVLWEDTPAQTHIGRFATQVPVEFSPSYIIGD